MKTARLRVWSIVIFFTAATVLARPVNQANDRPSLEDKEAVVKEVRDQLRRHSGLAEIDVKGATLDTLVGPDSPRRLRWSVCAVLYEEARNRDLPRGKRIDLVEKLSEQLVGDEPLTRQAAEKWLRDFPADVFSRSAKERIRIAFTKSPKKPAILLAGAAEVEELYPEIERLASLPLVKPDVGRYYGTPTWAALLVTARNGKESSIRRLIQAVKNEDDVVKRASVLFRELEYAKRPELVRLVAEYLQSDELLPWTSPAMAPLAEAWYAAQSLGRTVKGFPVDASIEKQKVWMVDHQQIDIK